MSVWVAFAGCDDGDYVLDNAIPRLQTPAEKIAWFRTKWRNGEHIETVYFDRQNRILESFNFGRSSWKKLFFYQDSVLVKTIDYWHSDSDELNSANVDTIVYEYDNGARLVAERHYPTRIPETGNPGSIKTYKISWEYTATGDTIKKWDLEDSGTPLMVTNINRWERDAQHRIASHYKLYIIHEPQTDTTDYFMRRFAYDSSGKLKTVWFEHMYLGKYYSPPGPDTISYSYDAQNRLVRERHRYTTDMRNKQEADTVKISKPQMDYIRRRRKGFFEGETYSPRNDKVEIVEYRYERFDVNKHKAPAMPN